VKEKIFLIIGLVTAVKFISAQTPDDIVFSEKRTIILEGTSNFRDIGGYPAYKGKTVKWNKIYRSADISRLTQNDLVKLASLNLAVDFDLRSEAEYSQSPDKLPGNVLHLQISGSGIMGPDEMRTDSLTNARQLMIRTYTNVQSFGKLYKPLFDQLIALDDNEAILYHCSAGKDRTGLATALILTALGVDRELIIKDYEATNQLWILRKTYRNALVQRGMDENEADALLKADPEYLQSFFKAIEANFGSVQIFLEKETGLTPGKLKLLRNKYLY